MRLTRFPHAVTETSYDNTLPPLPLPLLVHHAASIARAATDTPFVLENVHNR